MAETATGRYLYAITRGAGPGAFQDVEGIGGGRLDLVEHRGLTAVVSDVSLEEFGEDGLRRNLEDLAWLETVAREHDGVVQAVAASGPTAPLRLATICLDDEGVRARLDEWHEQLAEVLDRVEGRSEWSVKAFWRSAPEAAPAVQEPTASKQPGAGIAYLQRKRDLTQRRQQSEEQSLRQAEEIHAALVRHCVASRRLAPQDPRLTGHEGVMTLNGAYLVPAEDGDAFAAAVAALEEQLPEAHLQVGGPWPPYSFAVLEQT